MEKKAIDRTDEALRILFLGGVDESTPERGLSFILGEDVITEMSALQKERLFQNLSALNGVQTLGHIIREKLTESRISSSQLSTNASLPAQIVEDLLNDKIYTNNIPVVIFRNLLNMLGISFSKAEKAIRKTFDLLQSRIQEINSDSALYPSLRKNVATARQSNELLNAQSGARELYENKEALDKYINRLEELMK